MCSALRKIEATRFASANLNQWATAYQTNFRVAPSVRLVSGDQPIYPTLLRGNFSLEMSSSFCILSALLVSFSCDAEHPTRQSDFRNRRRCGARIAKYRSHDRRLGATHSLYSRLAYRKKPVIRRTDEMARLLPRPHTHTRTHTPPSQYVRIPFPVKPCFHRRGCGDGAGARSEAVSRRSRPSVKRSDILSRARRCPEVGSMLLTRHFNCFDLTE